MLDSTASCLAWEKTYADLYSFLNCIAQLNIVWHGYIFISVVKNPAGLIDVDSVVTFPTQLVFRQNEMMTQLTKLGVNQSQDQENEVY